MHIVHRMGGLRALAVLAAGPLTICSDAYAVGHAVADSPLGPFTKTEDPLMITNDVGRSMWLSEVTFADDGTVSLAPPTVDYPTWP